MINTLLFVKTDLLLHEMSFDIMKDFFSKADDDCISPMSILDSINYVVIHDANSENGVCIGALESDLLRPNINILTREKLSSGYILMTLAELKKFLSCEQK